MCETQLCPPAADGDQATARPTIGQIFRQYGRAYRAQHGDRLSREQLRVMDQLARCRTGELGHAVYRCDACGTDHTLPQSCGNRHCPLCQGHKAKQWLEQQLEKLLPCAYLAPYVYRVAISNRRLVKCEPGPDGLGRVTFTYRKSGSRRLRAMTVTAEEFIRRFLQHVLPRSFQKVRHYGFAHPRQRINLEWLKMLVTVTLNSVYVLLVAAQPLPTSHRPTCPDCGAEMIYVGFVLAPQRRFASADTS